MKKEELHIGATYHSVKFNTPVTLTLSDFTELEIIADGAEITEDIIAQMITPIELNEEWLKRCGFEKHTDEEFYHQSESLFGVKLSARITGIENHANLHIWDASFTGSPCDYVHQLQNLYFALTGHELEIK